MGLKSYRVRESKIQKAVVDFARSKAWNCWKIESLGKPDYIFLKDGGCFFIEFKAPGEKPTAAQLIQHENIEWAGFEVFVIDDIEEGKKLFQC